MAWTTALLVVSGLFVGVGVILPTHETTPVAATPAAEPKPAQPVRLRVPSIGLDTRVVPIPLRDDGVLEPPGDVDEIGWWDASARPGADTGQVVVTGHTVHTGGGALERVPELQGQRGARIVVQTARSTQRYRVSRVVVLSRAEVAQDAEDLFGQDRTSGPGARLVLVTCTDFNGSYYESNLVVLARPDGPARASSQRRA